MAVTEVKECSRCQQEKAFADFYWKNGRPESWCRACYRAWHRERYIPSVAIPEHPTCVVCGDEYTPKQRRPTKYCSMACRNQARITVERELRRDRTTNRRCEVCGRGLSFEPGRKSRIKFCSDECQIAAGNARRSPKERAASRFFRKYGITLEHRSALLKKQGGGCAICGTKHPGSKGWALDHDHACCPSHGKDVKTCGQCIRGVLCGRCNLAIGLFDDDPQRLRAAAKYLKKKRSP